VGLRAWAEESWPQGQLLFDSTPIAGACGCADLKARSDPEWRVKGRPRDRGKLRGDVARERGGSRARLEAWQRDDFDSWLTFADWSFAMWETTASCSLARSGGAARRAGSQPNRPFGMVFTVRSGKITRSIDYLSHQEALEAVGLRV
jgi:ketosteroid isomerase-like protein